MLKSVKLFFLISLFPLVIFSQNKIDVDWIFSKDVGEITKAPQITWLADGNALLSEDGNIYKYTIEDDKKDFLFDSEKATSSFNDVSDENIKKIWRPNKFDNYGRGGLYIFKGDLYYLKFSDSQFTRLTKTAEEEKSARFSPDGNKVAFIRNNNLYAYDINKKNELQLTNDGTETLLNGTLSWVYWEEIFGREDLGYWWSPDSKSIAFLQSDESEVDEITFMDHRTTVPTPVKQRYPKVGDKNPVVKVGMVNVEDKKIKWIDFGQSKYEYILRINWHPNSSSIAIQTMNRMQDSLDLWFSNNNGSVNHILTETNDSWINVNDDFHFIDKGTKFTWSSERTNFAHIYLYKSNGELINPVTSGDWAIKSSGGVYWVRSSISSIDEDNEVIYFTGERESSLEKQLYKVNFDGTGLTKLSSGSGTHRIYFAKNNKYYLDNFSNFSTPPSLAIYNNDGELIKQLKSARTDLVEKFNINTPEPFSIKARDGFDLPAMLYKPKDFDETKKYPIIFYVYGGPAAPTVQSKWSFWNYFFNVLLSKGYLVASVDNRSATGISKLTENTLLNYSGGMGQVNDLVDAVRWFKSQEFIDSSRVGVWGWSGGGSFTLNLLTHSKEFKAGIAVAAVTDWKYYDTKFAEFAMKTPDVNPDGFEATSYLNSAKNLHGNLLLVHGTYDDNVHIQNAWSFSDELIKANKLFEMMIYPMRKHGISDRPAFKHLLNTMLSFWERKL